jgi:hypothetical protein
MKKVFIIMMGLFLLISGRQRSYAMTHQECYAQCDSDYDKCVAPVINLPEPRTPEEQSVLTTCDLARGDCQRDCQGSPQQEDQPKQDDQPKQEDNK